MSTQIFTVQFKCIFFRLYFVCTAELRNQPFCAYRIFLLFSTVTKEKNINFYVLLAVLVIIAGYLENKQKIIILQQGTTIRIYTNKLNFFPVANKDPKTDSFHFIRSVSQEKRVFQRNGGIVAHVATSLASAIKSLASLTYDKKQITLFETLHIYVAVTVAVTTI